MSAIVLNVEDKQYAELQAIAKELNLSSVEDLLLKLAMDLGTSRKKQFDEALHYVLKKNHELYKRLS